MIMNYDLWFEKKLIYGLGIVSNRFESNKFDSRDNQQQWISDQTHFDENPITIGANHNRFLLF